MGFFEEGTKISMQNMEEYKRPKYYLIRYMMKIMVYGLQWLQYMHKI